MSLPPEYSNDEDYLNDCMSFCKHYRDLYVLPNTDVLTDNLNFHVKLGDDDNLNSFSESFMKEVAKLTPHYETFSSNGNEQPHVQSRMSKKKAHEIVQLTEAIKNVCKSVGCETVVDLGAGLGYIDYQIFLETRYNILGLEGQESLYVNAKEHQRKHHTDSLEKVKYIRHLVSEDSDTKIDSFLNEKFPHDENGFCFMGLHACGDLSVAAIKLFLKMERCRALVVTPCCYHKMAREINNTSGVKDFPMSKMLKGIYKREEGHTFLGTQFLRVAAQPAHIRDENIEDRVFYLLARALLKVYAKQNNCILEKKRRKPVNQANRDFAKYLAEATSKGFRLLSLENTDPELGNVGTEVPFDLTMLQSMWDNIPQSTFTDAALYISYQNHLAPIFENFVLYDRLVYLKENGIECCYFKKVINEAISPKCLSLVATKV